MREVFIFKFIAEYDVTSLLGTVELGLLEEAEVFSLDFLFLELLGAEWTFITFLHPAIDAFSAESSLAVLSTADHAFRSYTGADGADKLLNNSFVLFNCLVNSKLSFNKLLNVGMILLPFFFNLADFSLNLID